MTTPCEKSAEIARLQAQEKHLTALVEELRADMKTALALLAENTFMGKRVQEIEGWIKHHNNKPNRLLEIITTVAISSTVSFIVGYLMSRFVG